MKKFLFTLAALLMAGSAFADNYLYIADFEVAEAELGTEFSFCYFKVCNVQIVVGERTTCHQQSSKSKQKFLHNRNKF
jgi:hypothetical protein